jgi:hypothetical protein
MKHTFLSLFCLTFLFVTSCKKEDEVTAETAFFQCKIDNIDYKVEGTGAYAYIETTTDRIYGSQLPDKTIAKPLVVFISIGKDKGVGTHNLIDTDNFGHFLAEDGTIYRSNYKNSSGTLTISEKTDKHIKGTFSFVANAQSDGNGKKVTISDGAFTVVYR